MTRLGGPLRAKTARTQGDDDARCSLSSRVARSCTPLLLLLGSCSLMPRELNLTPLWFHRLDEHGELLEADALWPVVHYERHGNGADDFRIRPLYRRVTDPPQQAVEHQFLWPLGRVRTDATETYQRLWPLWSWRDREDENGKRDLDWYAIFPLLWGGWHEDGLENYFAFLPFYADIPQFVTYDRFQSILFPLYVRVDKEGHRHTLLLWPFIGFSDCAEGMHHWFRVFPFYGHDIDEGRHDRRFALWPFFGWGIENEDSAVREPVRSFWFWPIFGRKWSREVSGVSVLWPLFERVEDEGRFTRVNVLWPLFHWYEAPYDQNLRQWWLWPFLGHAHSDDQDNWSFLWPLIWWRTYDDPEVTTDQEWALPFFWHVRQRFDTEQAEDHLKLWPFAHRTTLRDEHGASIRGEWSVLSPIPWRDGNAYGVEEAYGFLWQVANGRQRAPEDRSIDVLGRAFTKRSRGESTTASMPFLFSYESDSSGAQLRLFHLLPIQVAGPSRPADAEASR